MDRDYILVECELDILRDFVINLESRKDIQIACEPSLCLAMVKAEDSMEKQAFYLGEVLCTECEVVIDENTGVGLCIGDEPQRGYCLAVIDALLSYDNELVQLIEVFLAEQEKEIAIKEKEEYNLVMKTRVDFKLMEES